MKGMMFGYGDAVPETITTAWGARWIYPDDMLHDRQSVVGDDFEPLKKWLNGGALGKARKQASRAAGRFMHQDSSELLILYKDATGIIVGSPRRSYGYVYCAAWVHDNTPATLPPAGTLDLTHRMKGVRAVPSWI